MAARDGQPTDEARTLAEGAAALKTQGEVLDKRLRAAGTQAQAIVRQAKETAGHAEAPGLGHERQRQAVAALGRAHELAAQHAAPMVMVRSALSVVLSSSFTVTSPEP